MRANLLDEGIGCHAPEINKRMRPRLKMSGASYRIDEAHAEVGTVWKHLYRAIDSAG